MGMLSLVLATTLAAAPVAEPVDPDLAAETASRAWTKQLAAELSRSDSARERALSTRILDADFDGGPAGRAERGRMLRNAAAAAPGDRLVQLIWAEADEEDSGCDTAHPCPERQLAMARLEPGNSASWIPVLAKADRTHDDKMRDLALVNLSKADHHDGLFGEAVDAWMTVFERHPIPEALRRRSEQDLQQAVATARRPFLHAAEASIAIAYSALQPIPPVGLFRHCRSDTEPADVVRSAGCRHLAELMMEGPSFMDRALGTSLMRKYDELGALEARRQLDWLMWQSRPAPGGNDAMGRDLDAYTADLRSTGSEIRAVELALQRLGIAGTPPEAWQMPKIIDASPAQER